MITVEEKGKTYYSATDLFKDFKDNPGIIIAKGKKSYGIKEGTGFISKGSEFYVDKSSAEKLISAYKGTLEGMIASRKLKEITSGKPEVKQGVPASDLNKDYGRRLTNISNIKLTFHAKQRITERYGLNTDSDRGRWLTNQLSRVGFLGQEFGTTNEIWGNDEATFVIDPSTHDIITVMEPSMEVNVGKPSFPELDAEIAKSIYHIKLAEERGYWEQLASQYARLAEFATLASKAIDKTRNAKSATGLSQISETVKQVNDQYRYLTWDIDMLNALHVEKMKYLDSKAKEG